MRLLGVHDRSFVLKRGIRLTRLSSAAVWQVTYWSYFDYLKFSPHKPAIWASFFQGSYMYIWAHIRVPYPWERGPTMECQPTPHFGLNFLLRSNVYLNMCAWVASLENATQRAGLWGLNLDQCGLDMNGTKFRESCFTESLTLKSGAYSWAANV